MPSESAFLKKSAPFKTEREKEDYFGEKEQRPETKVQ